MDSATSSTEDTSGLNYSIG